MKRYLGILAVCLLVLTACAPRSALMGQGGTAWGSGAFTSNGERIYFTATSERGERIAYSGGPGTGGMMMGGALTCASCHGPTAQGGQHVMHMQVMDAPDVRWSALIGEAAEGHGDAEEHADHAADYNLDTFRLAVVEGKHPDGEPLNSDMPRWTVGREDLNDLLDYLKSLPQTS